MKVHYKLYNEDCIQGARKHLKDNSIDLIITDPPYGIKGDKLHKHYNRAEEYVLQGYIEVPQEEYAQFSYRWIKEAERVLKPGGSIYIVSGYTNLIDILNALRQTRLKEINHIIWKYNFGVYTKTKFVSSHYHILYYRKPGGHYTFNTFCRYSADERDETGISSNYRDREDVWIINREYKPGQIKNKNELPKELLMKMILYSSNAGDLICDFFLGGFSTAKVAIGLNRNVCGFEKSKDAYTYQIKEMKKIKPGGLLEIIKKPKQCFLFNQGKIWSETQKNEVIEKYRNYRKSNNKSKKTIIKNIAREFGRGYFSILNVLKERGL
ncbi:MAG: site-specific DNA-methyltransferase [Elusimicrobia bacterium]|nr:site-specific DNA-methyltransferase [Elusimicrobiota bacterium]